MKVAPGYEDPLDELADVDLDSGFDMDDDKEETTDVEIGEKEIRRKDKRTRPFIILVAICAALGGLIFGFDIGGAGGTFVMSGFQEHFGWECAPSATGCTPASEHTIHMDQGLINGLFGAGATVGAVVSPWMVDTYGRRPGLFVASLVFIFGAGMQAGAPTMTVMWIGRVFSGLAIGSLSMVAPVYIAEVAPEHVRGRLSTLWQLAITGGILLAAAANLGLQHWEEGWRISYGGNIIFAIVLIAALAFMPESPRWLAAQGNDEKARTVLSRVRFPDEIEAEINELVKESQDEKERGIATWREVFHVDNKMRYRLFLGIGLQSVQQLSGINAIMFYAPNILKEFFGEEDSILGSFLLYLVNFASTFVCIYAVERTGRVKLLLSGGLVMLVSLIANAVLASREQSRTIGYVVVVFSAIFIVGFAYSWGPIVWTFCAEAYPLRARGKATGLTTMSNWIWTTIIGAVFPAASHASLWGCFVFFAVVISAGTTMVYMYMAETAQKTITEIDEAYKKHQPKLVRKSW
jgi:SP family sugar:H+ symporter-like MFS transporter